MIHNVPRFLSSRIFVMPRNSKEQDRISPAIRAILSNSDLEQKWNRSCDGYLLRMFPLRSLQSERLAAVDGVEGG
jgi:hypothetical protein